MPTLQRVALVATLVVAIVGGPGRDAGAQTPAPGYDGVAPVVIEVLRRQP